MIQKNLFLFWLGDNIPIYVSNVINTYKNVNPLFNVIFINYSLQDIQNIFNNIVKNDNDILLKNSIDIILSHDSQYEECLNKSYMYMLSHQEVFYGKEIRFIQLLSDIYRMKLINHYGGIYVDCDTFPLKQFDEKLLSTINFSVQRHYNNNASNNIANDNYFIGCQKNNICNDQFKILQTNNKWWTNVKYLIRKKKFFDNTLSYNDMQKYTDINKDFYIEHYFDGNWKNKNGLIRTQRCFLDSLYKNEY